MGGGLLKSLAAETLNKLSLLLVFVIFGFLKTLQLNSIFNWKSGSNIIIPQLRKSWLQSTIASVLDKLLDQTKGVKLCCYEIVSD